VSSRKRSRAPTCAAPVSPIARPCSLCCAPTATSTGSRSTSPARTRGSPCAPAQRSTSPSAPRSPRAWRGSTARAATGRGPRRRCARIAAAPGTRAADLAAGFGRERLSFKADVRKLKALGLTESLEVGYRLSPRGRAYLRSVSGGPGVSTAGDEETP